MADLATLGIAVDSSAMEAGTTKLQTFADTANVTGAAADALSAKLTTGMQGAVGSYVSNADRITAAAKQMNTVLSQVNATTGVTGGSDYAARGADIAAYGKQLDDLRAKYDPLYAASQNYKAALTGINQAASVGAISEKVRADAVMNTKVAFVQQVNALNGVRDAQDIAAASARGLSSAHAGMSTQAMSAFHSVRSMAEGLAMGLPPTMVLTQQLNHLSYAASGPGGLTGAFGEVKGMLGGFASAAVGYITPLTALTTGVVALGAGALYAGVSWSNAQMHIQQALIGIGARTGTTISQINNFASENASATGLSVSQAREAAIEFTKTGDIAIGKLTGLGDAVRGYSILTGKDATAATKDLAQAFSGDLVKGLESLNSVYGNMNPALEENVRSLVNAGDRTGALQVIISSMAKDNQKAEESINASTKALDAMGNAASKASNFVGKVIAGQNGFGMAGVTKPDTSEADGAAAFEKESNRIALAAQAAVKAIIPEIQQIQNLEAVLAALDKAKAQGSVGATGPQQPFDDHGASIAARNMAAAFQDAQAQAARYNEQVQAISASYQGVSQSTALVLHSLDNQLPVAQAVGQAAQLTAQYYATIAALTAQGKTDTDATRIAADQYRNSMAQIASTAQAAHQAAVDQLAVVSATTDRQKQQAQYQADYNAELLKTGDAMLAQQAAQDKLNLSQAAARAAEERAGNSATNSVDAADTAQQAAAASALQWQQNLLGVGDAAQSTLASINAAMDAEEAAYNASHPNRGTFNPDVMTQSGSFALDPNRPDGGLHGKGLLAGINVNVGPSIADVMAQANDPDKISSNYVSRGDYAGGISAIEKSIGDADKRISNVDTLTQLLNSQTSDKGVQTSNLEKEMAWLNTLPETIARDQKIVSLQQSIDSLTSATNANTAASLNPLYTQGAGALAIGYYHAANGFDGVAQGPTSGDQVPFHAMVNGGERIQITPAGQSGTKQSGSGGQPMVIQNFDFRGTQSNSRRSARQAAQGFGQTAAAMR